MGRLVRRAATAAVAVLAVLAVPLSARAEPVAPPPSPADVEIPYLGEGSIEPAPPWRIADCAVVAAASPLVTGCDASRITLAAPEYDPDAGVITIQVPLTNDAVSTTVGYRVRLAGPEAPTARPDDTAWPVAAGSLLRVPISELGLECAVCGAGGRLEVLGVEPASAGSAWATPTHVVFRSSSRYAGAAEVGFRFADDFGTWSAGAALHAAVYRPDAPLVTLDLGVPSATDGTASVALHDLVASIGGDDVVLVGCGAPIHGRVSCDGETARYVGPSGGVDQFAVWFAAGGEQASASVTVVPEASADAPGGGPWPVPAAPSKQTDGIVSRLVPPVPIEHHDTPGLFSSLVETLDRVGAR